MTTKRPFVASLGQRRGSGGARHEASERVVLRSGELEVSGWTLNVSRGGARVVLEEPVQAGAEYDVTVGDGPSRRARVVWVQIEADGEIVGIQYLGTDSEPPGSVPGQP